MIQIPEDKELSSREFLLSEVTPLVQQVYDTNPYCVLGISALSSRKEALVVSEKLAKYEKLKILHNYKSEFSLPSLEAPSREQGHIQTVMINLDKMKYRWLWFTDSEMISVCNRKVFDVLNLEDFTYEVYLICLFNCMVSDSNYSNINKWQTLLSATNILFKKNDNDLYQFIKCHVCEDDQRKYNYHTIVRSFKDTLLEAFTLNIEKQTISEVNSYLNLIKADHYEFKDDLIQKIATRFVSWTDYEMSKISDVEQQTRSQKSKNFYLSDARAVLTPIESFDSANGFVILENIATSLSGVGLYSELLQEKVRKTIWNATDIVCRAGEKQKAAKYDSKIYFYCNDAQRKKLKDIYNIENLSIPDDEFTADECDEAADRYNKAGNSSKEFIWRLKAANKGKASAMNCVGVAYALGNGVQQNEANAVHWYEKAAEKNDSCALRNLAARYYNGSLPGGKAKAKEYWIRSYFIDRNDNAIERLNTNFPDWKSEIHDTLNRSIYRIIPSRLEPYAEDGLLYAQFLLGKYSSDKEEAKRYLTKAALGGLSLAKDYLKEKFGVDVNNIDFEEVPDTCIYKNSDIRIEFCGIVRSGTKYGLKFWVRNYTSERRQIWLKNCKVNGSSYGSITKLNEYEPSEGHYNTYFIDDIEFGVNASVTLEIEYDDDDADEIATLCSLNLNLDFNTRKVTFLSTIDFEEVPDTCIYEDSNLLVEFCGIVRSGTKYGLKFWVDNKTDETREIWIKNCKVNGVRYGSIRKLNEYEPSEGHYNTYFIDDIKVGVNTSITLEIEYDDEHANEIATLCSLNLNLDFNTRKVTFSSSIDFEQIPDTCIYEDSDVLVEFCGIVRSGTKYGLKFWVRNYTSDTRQIWLKDCEVNGVQYESIEKLSEYEPSEGHYNTYYIDDIEIGVNTSITLEIEYDDDDATEIATLCSLDVNLDFNTGKITFSSTQLYEPEPEINYELSSDEFTDETIYEGPVTIEFCGVDLDYGEYCELSFWVMNDSDRDIALWARNICINGDEVTECTKIGNISADKHTFTSVTVGNIDPELPYSVSMIIEVDDSDNNTLYDACELELSLQGNGNGDFPINYKRLGGPATSSDSSAEANEYYCPNSRYIHNYGQNGLEIYFNSMPSESIRNYLKADGWRWFPAKKCWYTYYNESHLITAKMITGQI